MGYPVDDVMAIWLQGLFHGYLVSGLSGLSDSTIGDLGYAPQPEVRRQESLGNLEGLARAAAPISVLTLACSLASLSQSR